LSVYTVCQKRFGIAFYLKEKIKLSKRIKQALGCIAGVVIAVLFLSPLHSAKAENQSKDQEVRQHLKKIEEVEEKEEADAKQSEKSFTTQGIFNEKIRLNGFIDLKYEYLDLQDVDNKDSRSHHDVFVSSAALALRVFPNDWSKAKIVVDAEDVGKDGDRGRIRLDEAIGTVKIPRTAFYFMGGKTVMPFGVFEDRLLEGTLTEDLYEIDEWGVTLGVAPDFYGLDLSFSVYRNPDVIENLQSFDTHDFRPGRRREDKFRSYAVNVTLEPLEDTLILSAFFDSEPGDGRRNRSIGGALALTFWEFSLDAEYITALSREKGENDEENKESALVVGLAFDLLDSLELATRFELFDDDQSGDQDEVLEYRLIGGFNYEFADLVELWFLESAMFSLEYRFSKYEKEVGSNAADSQNMLQFQFSVGF
jgi:hypothetical protein